MHGLSRDLRYAVRLLVRTPAFTAIAVLCLALGIGVTTAVFTVVDAVVFRPLPYANSDRLVRIYTEFPTFPGGGLRRFPVSPPEYVELRDGLRSTFEYLDVWSVGGVNLTTRTEPIRVTATAVTGTLLESLGIRPERGRWITPADDRDGAPLAILISDGLWRRSFAADPAAVGREVKLNGLTANIVGIMPAGFQFPLGQVDVSEVWMPQQLTPADLGRRGNHRLNLLAKLRPGITLARAQDEIAAKVQGWGARQSSNFHTISPRFHPLVSFGMHDEVVRTVKPAMLVILGAVGFVLLIACVNVANLLLARAEARQKEISVRVAMGAGNGGLVRQFLIEGLLIALFGLLIGLALAFGGVRILLWAGSDAIPRAQEVGVHWRVLLFSIGVMLATAVAFGLAPLAQAITRNAHETLKAASGRTSATPRANALRRTLVVAELALALVLLISSGLMIQAFWKLQAVDVGFNPHNVLTMRVALPQAQYPNDKVTRSFYTRLEDRLAHLPGVISATVMAGLPPDRPLNANDTQIENFVQRPGGPIQNIDYWQGVGNHFLETVGARLVEGRFIDERDGEGATPSMVVNETLARMYWPGQSAIGHRMRPGSSSLWFTIVGVVADLKNGGPDRPTGTELFYPYRQSGQIMPLSMVIAVRTAGDPKTLVGSVRQQVQELDASLPVAQVRTLEEVVAATQTRPRFLSVLLTFFTVVALGLAAIGVYGVISYSVERRTTEFGIRMAIGADASRILGMVVRQGALLALAGIVAGVAAAAMLTRLMRTILFGIEPLDARTFVLTVLVLLVITMLASWLPARRATKVDPAVALRYE